MTTDRATTDATFDVPPDREVFACPYCERPFASDHQRALHLGERHGDALDDAERSAYETATAEEEDDLWLYHFKAVVALLAVYMSTGLAYLAVLSG